MDLDTITITILEFALLVIQVALPVNKVQLSINVQHVFIIKKIQITILHI